MSGFRTLDCLQIYDLGGFTYGECVHQNSLVFKIRRLKLKTNLDIMIESKHIKSSLFHRYLTVNESLKLIPQLNVFAFTLRNSEKYMSLFIDFLFLDTFTFLSFFLVLCVAY